MPSVSSAMRGRASLEVSSPARSEDNRAHHGRLDNPTLLHAQGGGSVKDWTGGGLRVAFEIRELSFAEILDTSFRLVRDNFLLLVGICAVINIPMQVAINSLPPATLQRGAGIFIVLLISLPLSLFVAAVLTFAVGELYLGRPVSIGQAYRQALGIFLGLVGTLLLADLAIMGGFLLLLLPGIYLIIAFILINPVVVFERKLGTKALGRSRELMRENYLRAIGIFFVSGILSGVINFALALAFGFLPWLLRGLAQGVTASVVSAFASTALVVLYFDIRCRKEAFDLEHLARLVESSQSPAMASTL
jgi:hypothetical protein